MAHPSMNNPGFAAGTLVHLKQGLRPIEEIRVGDWVLSHPDDRLPPLRLRGEDEYVYRQVTATFVHDDERICELTVFDLGNQIKETLKVTPGQAIFLKGSGWVSAEILRTGNALLTWEFANLMTSRNVDTAVRARVYNIELDELYTYYVGQLGVWTHSIGNGRLPEA